MIRRESFIYLQERRFVFAYVPKVACTNWKAILRHLSGFPEYLDSGLAHDRQRSGFTYLSDVDAWEEIMSNRQIAKFTFVRNPFTRVLSAYLNKVEPYVTGTRTWENKYFDTIFRAIDDYRRRYRQSSPRVNFGVFLDWLANSGDPLVADEHWLTQSRILSPTTVDYDFVGRFEQLAQDTEILLRRMGSDIPFPTREQLYFPGTNANNLLAEYYSVVEVELVRSIYREDFDSFGYSSQIPPRPV